VLYGGGIAGPASDAQLDAHPFIPQIAPFCTPGPLAAITRVNGTTLPMPFSQA